MRRRTKVRAALIGGTLWFGVFSAQAADIPDHTGALLNLADRSPSTAHQGNAPTAAGIPLADASPSPSSAPLHIGTQTSGGADTPSVPPTTLAPSPPSPKPVPASGGYAAGGSMSSSSSASQLYAQTTQNGWGCQAALQYLTQHANPEFTLICPGDAMGHQAMTCIREPGVCTDAAEIVIADPCPAAYENEAWNSWHMSTGPFDPYGWCSDWNNRGGTNGSPPPLSADQSQAGFLQLSG